MDVECGMRMEKEAKNPNSVTPDGPASFCGSTGGSPERILFPPIFFHATPFFPDHKLAFPQGGESQE
jgi:hypothetical protein